jgi:Fe-S-cluster containining protein
MGKNTVQFACHHCNHCCTEVICLPTPWDVIRIVRATGQDPYEFLDWVTHEDIDEISKNDPTWLECGGDRYMMALRRHGDRCHFLDKETRYCTIYEARPILCRLYPFKVTEYADGTFKGFVLHEDVGCPRHRDGVVQVKPLYDLYVKDNEHQDDYNQLVKVFNRQNYAGKKPHDFIEMFITGFKPEVTGGNGAGKKVWKVDFHKTAGSPLA